jgi:hypothetical protein
MALKADSWHDIIGVEKIMGKKKTRVWNVKSGEQNEAVNAVRRPNRRRKTANK